MNKSHNQQILGKSQEEWFAEFPFLVDMCDCKEVLWMNPHKLPHEEAKERASLTMADIEDAAARLDRFSSYFKVVFPETAALGGRLESPVKVIPTMKKELEESYDVSISGDLLVKLDSHLPISGSIKARGGIYEVLKLAEDIAIKEGVLSLEEDYSVFDSQKFRDLFGKYSIAVGSTGNLGLSIGIMSAKLGFQASVHMSADARVWKKELLRSKGVTVVEYKEDYSVAVKNGRIAAESDEFCHFVDDENSTTLFLGYAVAALRLKNQLEEKNIQVDKEHPLYVYLPCGVGGGPGGVAFGLKMVLGEGVHCFFAEPTHSCCMMLGMVTDLHDAVSVQDFGLDNKTVADGLAVGRASGFVGTFMKSFMDGCYSISDQRMFELLAQMADKEDLWLEPSALAGMLGPVFLSHKKQLPSSTHHLVWATGGNMVPEETMKSYYDTGKKQEKQSNPLLG